MNFSDFKQNKSNLIDKNQMSKIKGGGGTCGYMGPDVNGQSTVICSISYDEAMFWFGEGGNGSHWCCDSCGSSSYCAEE